MERPVAGAGRDAVSFDETGARGRNDRGPLRVSHAAWGVERIRTVVVEDHEDIARLVANRIATLIGERNASGEPTVLGLATGSTPIGVYRELIRMHRENGLSF
ncbi:MAG TPA: glucosamine-6-phosphate deaminase, partial [Gemmatimonadaceae bacterium]|nr:glucosamine-6-phosphate deaminase [Gemmatimonadaceae bacterium]